MQSALAEADVDGWLIFDFHGLNPIASGVLGLNGMATRRTFVLVPREGSPSAITHAIEQGPWRDWPSQWEKTTYSSWRALESQLRNLVSGKVVAMEYSPGDAIPYLDRVPAGVLEMVRTAGATVVSSGDLVTRFYAVWNDAQLESHVRAAEVIAGIAKDAAGIAGESARGKSPLTEYRVQQLILERFAAAGLETDHGPIVAIGANAANPHYEPSPHQSSPIGRGEILLIDLWAREPMGIFADQTWMFSLGAPSDRDENVWRAVRDARDAALALLRPRVERGAAVRGGEVDDAARELMQSRGFGDYFIHRTGHSIDPQDLHGSGPHIDNFETREERLLIPGVGFSIEPGVYLPDEVGMRTEVNAYIGPGELLVTPSEIQKDLIIV
ncbi:MAG TPA: M24 family metallopeptidase [Rhodothermia bacterium]|nr:M24 family metallopeptidase [Rhodothermia bacterium]